jgi:hypothetical protein
MRARRARIKESERAPDPVRIEAVQRLHDALEGKIIVPRVSRVSGTRPKAGALPCALHPNDPGFPSSRNRCAECMRIQRRARTARGEIISLATRYKGVKWQANRRGLEFTITLEEYKLLVSRPCVYASNSTGTSPNSGRIGLDRIDNSKGYISGNVQPCCGRHNLLKSSILTHEQTLETVHRYKIPCGSMRKSFCPIP